jgi:hypothetical protein
MKYNSFSWLAVLLCFKHGRLPCRQAGLKPMWMLINKNFNVSKKLKAKNSM